MPRTAYLAVPLTSYRETIRRMYRTLMYIRHTHVLFSVIPSPLQPVSYSPYSPPLLPFVGAASAILVPPTPHAQVLHPSVGERGDPTYTYARVHTYTGMHAPSRGKVLQVTAEGRDDKGREEEVEEETRSMEKGWPGLFRNPTCSERKTVKEEVSFRRTLGLGKRLNFYRPLTPSPLLFSTCFAFLSPPPPSPIEPRRVHSLQASSHGVTFLIGTPVPIFRRLHSAFFFARCNLYRESLQQELFRRDAILEEDITWLPFNKTFYKHLAIFSRRC